VSVATATCDLCGLGLGLRPVRVRDPERELQFCCEACRGIYELLHGLRSRTSPAEPGKPRTPRTAG